MGLCDKHKASNVSLLAFKSLEYFQKAVGVGRDHRKGWQGKKFTLKDHLHCNLMRLALNMKKHVWRRIQLAHGHRVSKSQSWDLNSEPF